MLVLCGPAYGPTEGRRIVLVEPNAIVNLDLSDMTRALFETVLSSHAV